MTLEVIDKLNTPNITVDKTPRKLPNVVVDRSAPKQPTITVPKKPGAIANTILQARQRSASDEQILAAIVRDNPDKIPTFQEAVKRGATPSQIVEEIIRQNSAKTPVPTATHKPLERFGVAGKIVQAVQDTAVGAAKGAANTVLSSVDLAKKGLDFAADKAVGGRRTANLKEAVPQAVYTPQNTAEKVGYGAEQIAEYLVPAGAATKISKAATTAIQAKNAGKLVSAGGRILAKSAAQGTAAGLVRTAQTGSPKEGLKTGAEVAALEGAFAGAGEAWRGLITPALQGKTVRDLQRTYTELFTGTKLGKKAVLKSASSGKDPASFLAKNGYVVDVSGGKVNSQPLIGQIQKDIKPLEDTLNNILKQKDRMAPGPTVSLDELGAMAKRSLNTTQNKASGTLSKQFQAIDNIIEELKTQFGAKVGLAPTNQIKQGQWAASHAFDLSQPKFMPDVNYAIGKAAKQTIERSVREVSVRDLNAYIGDYMDAASLLRRIDGNAVKGGRLGRYFGRVIGSIAGSHFGPGGSIGGAVAGDYIAELMQDAAIAGPFKRQILESIPKTNPLYVEAQKALQQLIKEGIERPVNTPALPGASTIFAGGRTYPEPKINIVDAEGAVGRDPKTGRMFRYYKSTGK